MTADADLDAKYRDDPRLTDELLALALTKDPDRDNDDYWQPVAVLQHRLPEILQRIVQLSSVGDEKGRDTAATILGQGRVRSKFDTDRCAGILLETLRHERAPSVMTSVIHALGHLHDPRAVDPLVRLRLHPDATVRCAVVSSLCGYEDEGAIMALIDRSDDDDQDVRNWATFGLGSQIDADTSAIREALLARLAEEDDEIRGEALVGLARRGDTRLVPALVRELDSLEPDVLRDWILITEAAEAVVTHAKASGAKVWEPILTRLAALSIGEPDDVRAAIARCAISPQ